MWALTSGDIGYQATCKYPIRKNKVIAGAYPKKGHLADNAWQGFVPLSELPYSINPEKGWLANGNNFVTSKNDKHGISHSFTYQHRVVRIGEMLDQIKQRKAQGGSSATVEDMKVMQFDTLDIQARDSMPDMMAVVGKAMGSTRLAAVDKKRVSLAKEIFSTWDFRFSVDSSAAAIFMAWEHAMANLMHETKIKGVRGR